jgi:hypothetical protein
MCAVLEQALHMANCYGGYNHIQWMTGGFEQWKEAGSPPFPEKEKYIGNDTRRKYY